MQSPRKFKIRPIISPGAWVTEHRAYHEYLGLLLEELRAFQARLEDSWPEGFGEDIPADEHPQVHRLCRKRDATRLSIVLFAALTAEACINYYGVRRIGERHYREFFERIPLERKLRVLLLLCDGIEVSRDAGVLAPLRRIVERRNELVHPQAKEVGENLTPEQRRGPPSLKAATEAIADCDAFLDAFFELVPDAADIDPRPDTAG